MGRCDLNLQDIVPHEYVLSSECEFLQCSAVQVWEWGHWEWGH